MVSTVVKWQVKIFFFFFHSGRGTIIHFSSFFFYLKGFRFLHLVCLLDKLPGERRGIKRMRKGGGGRLSFFSVVSQRPTSGVVLYTLAVLRWNNYLITFSGSTFFIQRVWKKGLKSCLLKSGSMQYCLILLLWVFYLFIFFFCSQQFITLFLCPKKLSNITLICYYVSFAVVYF